MDAIDVIRAKRDGHTLTDEQVDWVIDAYTRGAVGDEQMSALLMAIVFRGMAASELTRWTNAMIDSGERMALGDLGRPTADKHSTGGVGDKITLPLAPLVAACGVAVPQLSGRGLGHTGGTLDKLESIPGWRADVSHADYLAQLRSVGAVVCAAGETLAPADKKLYALRDVTGTVESIPLIASSIMSKKIAEGAGALVLDVKVGSGAFMKTAEDATELARTMVGIGTEAGVHTVALVTAMDRPLGRSAGNAVEVAESVEVLAGGGPADVVALTVRLAEEMLAGAGVHDADPAAVLAGGRAMDTWKAMIAAQGGDPDARLPVAREHHVVPAPATGRLTRLDAYGVGVAAWRLGAGRARKQDPVSATAGITWRAGVGDQVRAGEPLLELHTDDADRIPRALEALEGAVGVDSDHELLPLIVDRIAAR
jgi:thymidine phosphorylase